MPNALPKPVKPRQQSKKSALNGNIRIIEEEPCIIFMGATLHFIKTCPPITLSYNLQKLVLDFIGQQKAQHQQVNDDIVCDIMRLRYWLEDANTFLKQKKLYAGKPAASILYDNAESRFWESVNDFIYDNNPGRLFNTLVSFLLQLLLY